MNGQTSTRRGGIDHPDFEHTEISGAAATTEEKALGEPGRPFSRRSPFFIGFMGAWGFSPRTCSCDWSLISELSCN